MTVSGDEASPPADALQRQLRRNLDFSPSLSTRTSAPLPRCLQRIACDNGVSEMDQETARAFAESGAYTDLAAALGELSVLDEANRLLWAAQAVWLASSLSSMAPADLRSHYENLFTAAAGHTTLQRLLTAKLMWLAMPGGPEAENPDAAINATYVARKTAEAEGIETQQQFSDWLYQLLSSDRETVSDELESALVELVADRWIFDRSSAKSANDNRATL